MKTVCPNCHQKYDVPEDYLQQEVTCEKCQHDFFVTKAKNCPECGKANPNQAFQCHSCQHSFQTPTLNTHRPFPQYPAADTNDRSGAKLNLMMQIVTLFFGLGSILCTLNGIGMIAQGFLREMTPINRVLYILFGICAVAIFGRVSVLLSTLTQPKKKAVQTRYAQMSLLGCVVLSIIGLVISFMTEGYQVMLVVANLLTLLFVFKIFQLWNERCIMDEYYEEPEASHEKRDSRLARTGIVLGILGIIPGGGLLSIPAMVIGIITSRRSKMGTASLWLGVLGFLGNLVFAAFLMKNL